MYMKSLTTIPGHRSSIIYENVGSQIGVFPSPAKVVLSTHFHGSLSTKFSALLALRKFNLLETFVSYSQTVLLRGHHKDFLASKT